MPRDSIWLAFSQCPPLTDALSGATSDDPKYGFAVPVSWQMGEIFVGDGDRALVHLHRGAVLSRCDWGTDLRRDGPNVTSRNAPYGQKAQVLARLALLRAAGDLSMMIGTAASMMLRHDGSFAAHRTRSNCIQCSFWLHDNRYGNRNSCGIPAADALCRAHSP